MTDQNQNAEDPRRTIMLVYGMFTNGNPFWVFTAVKPAKYQAFLAAHKEGALDLQNFTGFGEIIVSGQGKAPPEDVTLKVAEMYQTDPGTLFQNIQDENRDIPAPEGPPASKSGS